MVWCRIFFCLSNRLHLEYSPNIVEADVFPPLRSQAPDPSIFLPYTNEDIAFEEEYEEYPEEDTGAWMGGIRVIEEEDHGEDQDEWLGRITTT